MRFRPALLNFLPTIYQFLSTSSPLRRSSKGGIAITFAPVSQMQPPNIVAARFASPGTHTSTFYPLRFHRPSNIPRLPFVLLVARNILLETIRRFTNRRLRRTISCDAFFSIRLATLERTSLKHYIGAGNVKIRNSHRVRENFHARAYRWKIGNANLHTGPKNLYTVWPCRVANGFAFFLTLFAVRGDRVDGIEVMQTEGDL